MTLLNIFEKLENTSSSNEKKKILESFKDKPLFKRVLFLALDPHVRFHVRKIPSYEHNFEGKSLSWGLDNLKFLSERRITGHAAIDHLHDTLSSVSPEDALVIEKIINKDLRCGVSRGLVNKVFPKLISEFKVPLCETLTDDNAEKYLPKNFSVEPKYDGMRVVVLVEDGKVSFYSRAGKPIETLDHTIPDILEMANGQDVMFDSETVSGSFQNTMSAVKRLGKNKTEEAKLIIFDMNVLKDFQASHSTVAQEERTKNLVEAFSRLNDSKYLVFSESEDYDSNSDEEPMEFINRKYSEYRKVYEGLIVKDKKAGNNFKRTRAWLKLKPCETIDVEITGFVEGTKKNVGKLGAFKYNYEGKPCRVGGGFSDDQREEFWKRRFEMVGTMIEIEIMEATETGSTRHSVFIRERNFKGEKG